MGCEVTVQTNYAEFTFCATCSDAKGRCILCGAVAPQYDGMPSAIDSPGMYVVTHDQTWVGSTADDLSAPDPQSQGRRLANGARVDVVEVATLAERELVRGRIDSPPGWISLLNLTSGYRWAEKGQLTLSLQRVPSPTGDDAQSPIARDRQRQADCLWVHPDDADSVHDDGPIEASGEDWDEDIIVPIGQQLELHCDGSWFLCEVIGFDGEGEYPYTVTFPKGEFKNQAVMLHPTTSRYDMDGNSEPFRILDGEEAVSEDDVIADILKNCRLDLSEGQLISVVRHAREHFQSEPTVLEIEADEGGIMIFGDIHGNLQALLSFCEIAGYSPTRHKVVFLGDYVDRGGQGLEVIALLLAWKVKYPDRVFLLRGNHEDRGINARYGFLSECEARHSTKLYRQLTNMFNYLPLAAIVGGELFCCHGGLGPGVETIRDISALDVHRPMDIQIRAEEHWQSVVQHLTWADPAEFGHFDTAGYRANTNRRISVFWGMEATDRFLETTGLKMIVRAHQVVREGYSYSHDGKVLTVFSSHNYCNSGNHAAVLFYGGDVSQIGHWRIDAYGALFTETDDLLDSLDSPTGDEAAP